MAGRKPKPTKLHILNGNPSRKNLNTGEPEPDVGIPRCPTFLRGIARKEWNRISKELLKLGLISNIDMAALSAYCSAFEAFVEAHKQLKVLVGKTTNGNVVQNPFLSIQNRQLEIMHKFLIEFGMTPSSRTRLGTGQPKKDKDDPLEDLLSGT